MMNIKKLISLLCIALAVVSCNINDGYSGLNHNEDNAFAQHFGNEVSRNFIGRVVDTNNNPIENVTITIGASTGQTDVNGVFIISNAQVYEKFAYIKATKVGYLDGSRSMVPTTGKNNVTIMMLPNAPQATIQAGATGEVALPNGSKVVFDGAFEDQSGVAYTGAVSVAMVHLTSSDANLDKLMPGMLYARTADNKEAALQTFGMMNLELRGSDGQKLNIAEGHTAEITMLIDNTQLATAPTTIPLWHFDEEKGYWREDGVATKTGNTYVGTVSHFSWWNCDMPNSSILLTFNFVDTNGNPLPNLQINLLNADGYHASGATDSNGQLAGILPANQTFTLNVYSSTYSCGNGIIYSASVGPFATDTVVPNVVISASGTTMMSNVTGTLLKCDGTPMTNGYVILSSSSGNYEIMPVTNGTFNFNETYCSGNTQFTLVGFDYDTQQTTGSISYTFTSPTTSVGVITACNTISEFISYKIDANPAVFYFTNLNASTTASGGTGSQLSISADQSATGQGFYLWGTTIVPGLYTSAEFSIESPDIGGISSGTPNTIQFNLSSVGAIGDYIDMTFSGTYDDLQGTGVTHTITGTIHVLRDF